MAFRAEKVPLLSLLLALAVCANILELFLPSVPFLPWLKPGLANAFTLAAILLAGPGAGLAVALLRSLISGVISGVPATSLLIGGSGGLVSALGMGALFAISGKRGVFSPIGLAVAGAFLHNLTQLAVVYLLFVRNAYVFWQLPLLGPVAVVTGIVTGLLAAVTADFVSRREALIRPPNLPAGPAGPALPAALKMLLLILAGAAVFAIPSLPVQALFSTSAVTALFLTGRKSRAILLLRFLPLLILTLVLNALTLPGHYVAAIPFLTKEGLSTGAFYALRTINLIGISFFLFTQADLIALLTAMGKRLRVTALLAEVGISAIRLLPSVTAILKDFYLKAPSNGLFSRLGYLRQGFGKAMEDIIRKA